MPTNNNEAILARIHGAPAKRMTLLEAMMDQTNPNVYEANDNDPVTLVRYYRLHCIDCRATTARSPEVIYAEHRVEALGVIDAWGKAQRDGYWPLHVIESDWLPETEMR